MKVTLERQTLLRTLAHIQGVVERRNTIPILANVLIRAQGEKVSFTATDMDLELIESCAGKTAKPGALTAPAHTLYEIVRKLPEGSEVELSAAENSNQVKLAAGRSHFRLGTLPVDDFPQMAEGGLTHRFSMSAADLRLLIDRTRFAISTEETRYYLNGIFMHAKEEAGVSVLRAVATDGHRLARVEMPAPEGSAGLAGVIIPRKAINEVRKLLEDASGNIEIGLGENKIRFAAGDLVLTSKLIDGTFPDYERVIPSGNDKHLDVPARVLFAAVDRVATIASEKSRAVKLSLAEKLLTLSATSPEAGSAQEEMEVDYSGTPMEIGFNARYLLDITQQIEGDTVRLNLADAASPTILSDPADASALYVLMPMRV